MHRGRGYGCVMQNPINDMDADLADAELYDVDDTPDIPEPDGALTSAEVLAENLRAARRRLVPVRRGAIQRPRTVAGSRIGPLLGLALDSQHLAFDLELLNLALQPITTDGDDFSNVELANMMSTDERRRHPPAISRAWGELERRGLIVREVPAGSTRPGRPTLLREDGTGGEWTHPGIDRDPIGYFSVPRVYWLNGFADTLSLPGKAMLMIMLAETNEPTATTLTHTHAQFSRYFGPSESTVKRGLNDLRDHDILGERWDKRPARRSATGETQVGHYWLKAPFSTPSRQRARDLDQKEIDDREPTAVSTTANDPSTSNPVEEAADD